MREITVSHYRNQYPCIENIHDQGFGQGGACRTSLKNEYTWYEVLGYYDTKYDSTPRVFEGWWHGRHFVHYRNADRNLYVRCLYWDGDGWDWIYDWLGFDFYVSHPAAVSASIPDVKNMPEPELYKRMIDLEERIERIEKVLSLPLLEVNKQK